MQKTPRDSIGFDQRVLQNTTKSVLGLRRKKRMADNPTTRSRPHPSEVASAVRLGKKGGERRHRAPEYSRETESDPAIFESTTPMDLAISELERARERVAMAKLSISDGRKKLRLAEADMQASLKKVTELATMES